LRGRVGGGARDVEGEGERQKEREGEGERQKEREVER